jgi:outer membrane protein
MKNKFLSAISAATLGLALSLAPAVAQDSAKIAFVDMAKITADAKAAKNLQAQVQEQERVFGTEVQSKQREFQQQEEELRRQQSLLDQAAFEKQLGDFQRRTQEAERQIQEKNANIRRSIATAEQKLQENMIAAITDVARQRGYDLVVTSQSALLLNPAFEITTPVLQALDQRLPSLKLEIAAAPAAPAAAQPARPAGNTAPARPAAQN